jgi:hypothetical protein
MNKIKCNKRKDILSNCSDIDIIDYMVFGVCGCGGLGSIGMICWCVCGVFGVA